MRTETAGTGLPGFRLMRRAAKGRIMPHHRQSAGTSLLLGAIGGIVATAAMTICMDALYRRLPKQDRYPLPPRELTERVAEAADLRQRLDDVDLVPVSVASHFGYGLTSTGRRNSTPPYAVPVMAGTTDLATNNDPYRPPAKALSG
jgi:hypothetical protein